MNLYQVIQAAVADFDEHGYDSEQQLNEWLRRIREAADASMSDDELRARLVAALKGVHDRFQRPEFVLRTHPGVSRYTLQMVAPRLRNELDRRIMASANLIKLNRVQARETTLRRFSGWATSIPTGGSNTTNRTEVKADIIKSMRSLPFAERRVITDQGHKFAANLSEIIATDGGAVAGEWHSRWRVPGYDYREDHKERDLKVYALRGNWALAKGLMNSGAGYVEDMTRCGEEPFCSCKMKWIFGLSRLPSDMLTQKGRDALASARTARAA